MNYEITSAKEALKRSKALKSRWSDESLLTQRTLIYVAFLLEQIVKNTTKRGGGRRKKSAWNAFLSEKMKEGKTMQEAAEMYKIR